MQEKEKQIRNSFLYLLPIIVGNIYPFITMPIFTRILTTEDFGVLALAHVYAVLMCGISNFGLTNVYNRDFFQYRDQKSSAAVLYSTLIFVINNMVILTLLTYFFRHPLSKYIIGSTKYGNLLFWAFCSAGVMSLKSYYLSYFKNSENAKKFVWYTINESTLTFIFSLVLVGYLRVGVIGIVWGQLLANIIIFIVLTVKFCNRLQVSFNLKILKKSLKLSYPLTPKIFLGVIASQFDKYMIGLLASLGGVGIYSIAQRVSYLIFTYMIALNNVYQPQVFSRMFDLKENGGEEIGRYLTPFAYASIVFALLISLFSEEIIMILTPVSYHGAIDIVMILSMYFGILFFTMHPQLLFAKKTHISSLLTFFGIGLNIVLNILFIRRWGAMGAAWATFLSGMISGTITFKVSQHYYKIKYEYIKIGLIYLIFIGSTFIILMMRYSSFGYDFRILSKCLCIGLYLYLGVRMKLITIENYRLIKTTFRIQRVISTHDS